MARVEVARSAYVHEGQIDATQRDKRSIVVTRVEGRASAVENKCARLGWSMAKGTLTGATLTCPWHGSKYDVCSGKNLDWVGSFTGPPMPRWTHRLIAWGKAPAPIQAFDISKEDGLVFIDLPG